MNGMTHLMNVTQGRGQLQAAGERQDAQRDCWMTFCPEAKRREQNEQLKNETGGVMP